MYRLFYLFYLCSNYKIIKALYIFSIAPPQATSQSSGVSCARLTIGPYVLGRGADCRRLHNASPIYYDSPLLGATTLIKRRLFLRFR